MSRNINLNNKILYMFLSLTILLGYYFGEDSSGSGGFVADFNNTWPVLSLIDRGEYFNFSEHTIHFPLHYYFLYFLNIFFESKDNVRLIFCIISLATPYIFYLILSEKFSKIDKNKLFFFALILFLLPSFRSGAIWANTQITALIFFLYSLHFFIKWENKNSKRYCKDIVLQCFFLSCAVYSRQLYAIIFIYILVKYFFALNYKDFLKTVITIFIFAVPGFLLVLESPRTLQTTFDLNFFNSFLVNTSIISFYLIPLIFLIDYKKIKDLNFKRTDYLILLIFAFLIFIAISGFNYNPSLGGGFFIKFSILIFNNLYFFFFTSFVGLISIYLFTREDKLSILLFLLLIFGFSSYQIFQKYFEPMFLILMFLIIKNSKNQIFLSNYKKILLFKSYFLVYFFSAITNDIFKITKSFV